MESTPILERSLLPQPMREHAHVHQPPIPSFSALPIFQQLRSAQEQAFQQQQHAQEVAFQQQQHAQEVAFQRQQQTLANLEMDRMYALSEQTAQDVRHLMSQYFA